MSMGVCVCVCAANNNQRVMITDVDDYDGVDSRTASGFDYGMELGTDRLI